MRIDLGLGPLSPAALRRGAGAALPAGFALLAQGGEPIFHRGQKVIVRTGE